jgi:DNA-binding transcriptional MerR regulator
LLYCRTKKISSGRIKDLRDDDQEGVFAISIAAKMASMEIHNLRVYERHGLVSPSRTSGGTRLYSVDDVSRLVRIRELLEAGLNLAGIAHVLELEATVSRLEDEMDELDEQREA